MKKKTSIIVAILCLVAMGSLVFFVAMRSRAPEIRHIVLISIDTCRADHLSCYGYPRPTTPNIDAFAQTATRFEHVVSPVPITLPAHSSMLTGMIPPTHGVHHNIGYRLTPSNLTLAEILKPQGFSTTAIISSYVLDKQFGLAQGFDVYNDTFEKAHFNKDIVGNERRGDETTRIALDWLEKNRNTRSFLFLHYYDPHMDYEPPEPFASEYADNLYAGEIAFTDHCIGRVILKLKDLNLYDSTLLIITGDHGEMLGEHGEKTHTYFIYESAIRVPLILKLPGQKQANIVAKPVGLVDIVPTLCSLLKIDISPYVQGMDLSSFLIGEVPDKYERFIYSESVTPSTSLGASSLMAISTGRWKYIQAPRPELYNLSVDSGEENNLVEKEPHRARILEDKLKQTLEQSLRKDVDSRVQLDAESIKRLESLGYVAGKVDGEITFDENKEDPKDLIGVFSQYHKAQKLIENKKYKEAKQILEDLIPQRPEYDRIYILLSDVEMCLGGFNQAIKYSRRAKQINPEAAISMPLCNNLAWLQATRPSLASRNVDEALMLARKVCKQTNFNDPNALDTLAVVYAAKGDFTKAVETARKAQALAVSANDGVLAQKIAKRLKLFEQSKPYIEE